MKFAILASTLVLATLGLVYGLGDGLEILGDQEELRTKIKDQDPGERWIYDDWSRAVERAKAEKKPLLVSFRCVP